MNVGLQNGILTLNAMYGNLFKCEKFIFKIIDYEKYFNDIQNCF